MRRSTALDPVVAAELEALDEALAGRREDPEIALIAREVRASVPPMPPRLEQRLEEAAAAGFPRPRRERPRAARLAPALGLAGAATAAVVIGVSSGGGGGGVQAPTAVAPQGAAAEQAAGGSTAADSAAPGAASTVAPVPPDEAAAPGARRVQRAADLVIATPLGRLQDTADAVTRTVDRLGGYVQSSDVSATTASGQATFDLRIPAARLDEGLATLSRLGHVRSRTQQSEDITARFVSARSRLTDARAERRALLRALARASTPQEIESLRARLAIARSRIAAARGDLFAARRAANLARVSVTVLGVRGDEGGAAPGGGDSWTPGKALEDALQLLSTAAGVAIVALAGAVPAALLALLGVLLWRTHRRRSRELALRPRTPAV